MTDRCAPPNGTPAGTACVLVRSGVKTTFRWIDGRWVLAATMTPEVAAVRGWRFVRVAGEGDG